MSTYVELLMHSLHRRRVSLASISMALSVLLHMILLIMALVAPSRVPFLRDFLPEPPPREPPMRLQQVHAEPEPVRAPAATASGAGGGSGAAVQPADVTRLAVPPDTADVEPPAAKPGRLAEEAAPLLYTPPAPPAPRAEEAWQPRREILAVEQIRVQDELARLERRRIPEIARVSATPDVVYPAKPLDAAAALAAPATPLAAPDLADIIRRVTQSGPPPGADGARGGGAGGGGAAAGLAPPGRPLAEPPGSAAHARPIEALLSASITTYTSREEPGYGYFRIEIQRRSDMALPVIPKDILFVQDCSASMAESRLYFCRQALAASLEDIGPQDRFNVVAFRDRTDFCFPAWATNTPDARARAADFIQAFRSEGETDLFAGIRSALAFTPTPGRPVITLLISDGRATTGLTGGNAIIREFTRANNGAVSVFTMSTTDRAFHYLLDLLSYGNRGDTRGIRRGRWDIPDTLRGMVREVSQPVLTDVRLRVAQATPSEVYPIQTMNLYSDRPLLLYGRYPLAQTHVVFQATGQAGGTACDMVFDLSLRENTLAGDESLRQDWARQKVYHLLSEYARTERLTLVPELDRTARMYKLSVPYREALQP